MNREDAKDAKEEAEGLRERTKTPLTIIHEGKPLVIIYPATTQTPRPLFGTMKGSGEILGDLIAPVAELWEVLE